MNMELLQREAIKFRESYHLSSFLYNEEIFEYLRTDFPEYHAAILSHFQNEPPEEMQGFLTNMREEENDEVALANLKFLKGREVYNLFYEAEEKLFIDEISDFLKNEAWTKVMFIEDLKRTSLYALIVLHCREFDDIEMEVELLWQKCSAL